MGSTEVRKATGTEGKTATGELKTSSFHGSLALSSISEGACDVEASATFEGASAVNPIDGFEEGTFDTANEGFGGMDGRFEGFDSGALGATIDGFDKGCAVGNIDGR